MIRRDIYTRVQSIKTKHESNADDLVDCAPWYVLEEMIFSSIQQTALGAAWTPGLPGGKPGHPPHAFTLRRGRLGDAHPPWQRDN